MKFRPSNVQDISKYFKQTFVKFTELGDKILFVNRVDTNEVLCIDENEDAFVVELREDDPYTMDYSLPHRGLFLYGSGVYQLRRTPARQWRQGICSENTSIVNIHTGKNATVSFEILKAFTEKPQYGVLSSWIPKEPLLLSQRLVVTAAGSIYCDRLQIGAMGGGQAKINTLFENEVKKVAGTCNVVGV